MLCVNLPMRGFVSLLKLFGYLTNNVTICCSPNKFPVHVITTMSKIMITEKQSCDKCTPPHVHITI